MSEHKYKRIMVEKGKELPAEVGKMI